MVSQNFHSRIADMRAELDFEINVRTEQEVTKLLRMIRTIQESLGVDTDDPELPEMEERTDVDRMKAEIEEQAKR